MATLQSTLDQLNEKYGHLPYKEVTIVVEAGMMHVGHDFKTGKFTMEHGEREEYKIQARSYGEASILDPSKAKGRMVRYFLGETELFYGDPNRNF